MKFAALISGGKDSTFNILECLSQGHQLVALVNLHPPTSCDRDELDSYMYQCVAHEAIDHIARAIGDIPLYRAEIRGCALSTELDYTADFNESYDANDEVEDLFQLISVVKENHPNLEAISTGAILSNYQRTRVENICERLGLVSLAFLWQRSQIDLLQLMTECNGFNPILVKIAAFGLNERKHLGKSLRSISSDLIALSRDCELNPCGEGGEYETVTLDSPFYQKKIEIDQSHVVTLNEDDFAAVKYLKIDAMRLKDKEPQSFSKCNEFFGSELCSKLNLKKFTDISLLEQDLKTEITETLQKVSVVNKNGINNSLKPIFNILSVSARISQASDASTAMYSIIEQLQDSLKSMRASKDQIMYCVLCLPDMTLFHSVNMIYRSFFSGTALPGRTCIATNRDNQTMLMHCYLNLQPRDKYSQKNMLVRSFSHWAPATIGPYSQAVSIDSEINSFCFLSGQIALHPENLSLIDGNIEQECLLGLRHITRVTFIHSGMSWNQLESMICYCIEETHMEICRNVFHLTVCCLTDNSCLCSRVHFVTVQALPKDAKVEWQSIFSRNSSLSSEVKISEKVNDSLIPTTMRDIDAHKNSQCGIIYIDSYLLGDKIMKNGELSITFQ